METILKCIAPKLVREVINYQTITNEEQLGVN